MLVFNEGVPRSGKSYDAVKNHILPALKRRRKVYARLNGLNHEKIATHLQMDLDEVKALLVHVPTSKVVDTFQAFRPLDGEGDGLGVWTIPEHLRDALFVIDEVHEFYVTGRQALPEPVEQFFALHGQNGMDGVIMTQAYKRLHPVIRARIERKNQFQKLTAVGLKSRYRVRYFTTVSPDRYESVGGETLKYDSAIFPLYAGYAQGASNVEVYDGGGRTIWKKLGRPMILAVLALCFAVPTVYRFLHGDTKLVKDAPKPAYVATSVESPPRPAHSSSAPDKPAPVKSAVMPYNEHGAYDTTGMPPEVAYVFQMSQQARPRLVVVMETDVHTVGIIEWREDQGHVLEKLTFDQLRDLGLVVDVKSYGARLSWNKQVIVVTPWPVDMPGTIPQDYRASDASPVPATPSVSEPTPESGELRRNSKGWPDRQTAHGYVPPEQTVVSAIGG